MTAHNRARGCARAGITGGLVLMTVGIIFLLNNFNVLDGAIGRWWPVILIVIGVSRLIAPGRGTTASNR